MHRKKLIMVAVMLLLIWPVWRLAHHATSSIEATPSAPEQRAKTLTPTPSATTQKPITTPSAEEEAKISEEKQRGYLEKARGLGNSLNRPGNFYGQIIDQNSQPVAGVKIKCGLSYFNGNVLPGLRPHYDEFERTTDNLGRFSVEGKRGLSLDLKLQSKQGYEFRPTGLGVTLRDISPNQPAPTLSMPDKPYIFRAFKKGSPEALLIGSVFYLCEQDGRPYIVRCRSNQIIEGTGNGELKIAVRRSSGRANQTDYDWSVQIDGVEMELLETNDVFMYQAPASGYESSWSFSRKAGEKGYIREVNPKFYLKSRDGSTYGRIEMHLISDYRDKFGVRMSYWLNPRGSRNLEYDPLQNVTKQLPAAKP